MDEIEKLRERSRSILAEMEKLDQEITVSGTDSNLSVEERQTRKAELQEKWDQLEAELRHNEAEIKQLQAEAKEREDRKRKLNEARKWFGAPAVHVKPNEGELFDIDYRQLGYDHHTHAMFQERAQRVLDERHIGGHLTGRQRERLTTLFRTKNGDTDGELLAAYTVATSDPRYRSAFQKAASGFAPVFDSDEARAIQRVNYLKRAMAVGSPATGGYAVPVVIDPTIILTAQGSENDILRLARVETITNDRWRGLSSAGVSWKFGAEASAATDNAPTIAQPEVPTYRADGFIPFSIEIGQDWPGFAERMSELLGSGYSELLAEKLTTGTGSDTPQGLISVLAAQTDPDVSTEVATAGAISGPDIYDMWARLPQRHRRKQNTAWMSSTDVQNAIRQLGTVDPNFSVNITNEALPRLFGREYPMNDYMEDMPSGTGSQALLVVGDFQGYLVAQRAGMSIEFVPMLFDRTNNMPTGQRGWFAYARVGADVIDPTAFQLLTNKAS